MEVGSLAGTALFCLGEQGSAVCFWVAGLLYCMSYLEQNMDWLQEQLQPLQAGKKRAVAWPAEPSTD